MAYGGLRGAVTFALVVLLDENVYGHRHLLITTTIAVIYVTNFFLVIISVQIAFLLLLLLWLLPMVSAVVHFQEEFSVMMHYNYQ